MPKREIPAGANAATRFAIVMDGLIQGSALKEPKDGRYNSDLGSNKWAFYKEKSDG